MPSVFNLEEARIEIFMLVCTLMYAAMVKSTKRRVQKLENAPKKIPRKACKAGLLIWKK